MFTNGEQCVNRSVRALQITLNVCEFAGTYNCYQVRQPKLLLFLSAPHIDNSPSLAIRLYLVYTCKLQFTPAIGILSNETGALSFIPAVIGLNGHLGLAVKLEIRIMIKHCTSETDARL